MLDLDIILAVITFTVFICIETYFLINEEASDSKRISLNSGLAIIITVLNLVILEFLQVNIVFSVITEIIILVYVAITENFFYHNRIKVKAVKKPKQMFVLIFGGCALLVLIGYSCFTYQEGGIFGSNDNWFSETFLSLISSANMVAVMTLMIIGSFVIIMAKARRQPNMGVAGYFLVIGLPLFDLIQTLFSKSLQEDIVDSAIYNAFENVALALIIYMIMKMIFYMLMISVVVSMLSQLE